LGAERSGAPDRSVGFSLVELMIVIAIVAIIAAVAIPSLIQARMSANESAAIGSLRTLSTAELHYRVRMGTYGTMGDLLAAGSLDASWADGRKSGYLYTSHLAPGGDSWSATADPESPGVSGERFFFADQSGVIRWSLGAPAGAADPPIE
jgi:prepilin-type N-terminal cleavage/methylation domain-containing protein